MRGWFFFINVFKADFCCGRARAREGLGWGVSEGGDMPHFSTGSAARFAVKMDMGTGDGEGAMHTGGDAIADGGAQEIDHRSSRGDQSGGSKGPIQDRPNVILEL